MRVTLVHGYFLHDSGSGVYVRELARAFVRLGHDVTLVCQEREPERCDFIDSAYVLEPGNTALRRIYSAPRLHAGSCRLVRPDLAGELLVYVEGSDFPGFDRTRVTAFQNASAPARERYVAANVAALRTTFAEWPTELALAQHLIMQPFVVRAALAGSAPYMVTEHGSALNFSVRTCEELVPYAVEGLSGAVAVATVSSGARDDLLTWAAQHGLDTPGRIIAMSPGIDTELFSPRGGRRAAIEELTGCVTFPEGFDVSEGDDVLAYAGGLRNTKGVQHAVAALPLIEAARGRRVRLLVAGDGPAEESLRTFAAMVEAGDAAGAQAAVSTHEQLQSPPQWGAVVVDAPALPGGPRVAFLGHVDHEQLASVFAASDVAVVPSVFPEAAALVSVEALASGALPLASYHSGMVALDDFLADTFQDGVFTSLRPGTDLTSALAAAVVHVLGAYPTAEPAFRTRVHDLTAGRFRSWELTAQEYVDLASRARPEGV
jgi:glycosyltransferase involved in cell wall biosynthesis